MVVPAGFAARSRGVSRRLNSDGCRATMDNLTSSSVPTKPPEGTEVAIPPTPRNSVPVVNGPTAGVEATRIPFTYISSALPVNTPAT